MPNAAAPLTPHVPLIVFTDLDGTLLDHDSYSYQPALPALTALRGKDIPVVLASSKTAAEIAPLRQELGFEHVPAIVENGSGILAPHAKADADQSIYQRLRAALADLPAGLRKHYQGFGDWGPQGIADHTGLPLNSAILAGQRAFSEPGVWIGAQDGKQEFLDALATAGILAREGGRFLTLSFGGTKASQMDAVMSSYNAGRSVALGDAPNDIEMLEHADIGVIIANPHRPPMGQLSGETRGRIRRSDAPGPQGWNTAIMTLLHEFGI